MKPSCLLVFSHATPPWFSFYLLGCIFLDSLELSALPRPLNNDPLSSILTSLGDFTPFHIALCSKNSQTFISMSTIPLICRHILHSPPLSLDVSWVPQTKGFQNDFSISQHAYLSAFPVSVNDSISRQKAYINSQFLSVPSPPPPARNPIQSIRNLVSTAISNPTTYNSFLNGLPMTILVLPNLFFT